MAKILLVDDDPVTSTVHCAILEGDGHEVVVKDRALSAAMSVVSLRPDIVLLDVEMPDLNGDQIVDLLVRDFAPSERPQVLLHSGREKEELEAIVKAVGADGCIPKTPNPAEFLAAFRTLTSERGR